MPRRSCPRCALRLADYVGGAVGDVDILGGTDARLWLFVVHGWRRWRRAADAAAHLAPTILLAGCLPPVDALGGASQASVAMPAVSEADSADDTASQEEVPAAAQAEQPADMQLDFSQEINELLEEDLAFESDVLSKARERRTMLGADTTSIDFAELFDRAQQAGLSSLSSAAPFSESSQLNIVDTVAHLRSVVVSQLLGLSEELRRLATGALAAYRLRLAIYTSGNTSCFSGLLRVSSTRGVTLGTYTSTNTVLSLCIEVYLRKRRCFAARNIFCSWRGFSEKLVPPAR